MYGFLFHNEEGLPKDCHVLLHVQREKLVVGQSRQNRGVVDML